VELDEQLRVAIRSSGLTVYRIAKSSGVTHDRIYRFMHGTRSLSLRSAGKVCAALGLELVWADPPADGHGKGRGKGQRGRAV
jgi:DNA-binding phage protein